MAQMPFQNRQLPGQNRQVPLQASQEQPPIAVLVLIGVQDVRLVTKKKIRHRATIPSGRDSRLARWRIFMVQPALSVPWRATARKKNLLLTIPGYAHWHRESNPANRALNRRRRCAGTQCRRPRVVKAAINSYGIRDLASTTRSAGSCAAKANGSTGTTSPASSLRAARSSHHEPRHPFHYVDTIVGPNAPAMRPATSSAITAAQAGRADRRRRRWHTPVLVQNVRAWPAHCRCPKRSTTTCAAPISRSDSIPRSPPPPSDRQTSQHGRLAPSRDARGSQGRTAGWLALTSGVAGGADVILIPEIRIGSIGLRQNHAPHRSGKRSASSSSPKAPARSTVRLSFGTVWRFV